MCRTEGVHLCHFSLQQSSSEYFLSSALNKTPECFPLPFPLLSLLFSISLSVPLPSLSYTHTNTTRKMSTGPSILAESSKTVLIILSATSEPTTPLGCLVVWIAALTRDLSFTGSQAMLQKQGFHSSYHLQELCLSVFPTGPLDLSCLYLISSTWHWYIVKVGRKKEGWKEEGGREGGRKRGVCE